MTAYSYGDQVRERETRWSPVVGTVVGLRGDDRVAVHWYLNGLPVAYGAHDPANLEPAT